MNINLPPINLYNIGPMKTLSKNTRSSVLVEADTIVNGARADEYGGPEDSFQKIASLWTAYLSSMNEQVNISAADVACMMILLKIARLANSPDHRDSWVDIAGYAACGAEVALRHEVSKEIPGAAKAWNNFNDGRNMTAQEWLDQQKEKQKLADELNKEISASHWGLQDSWKPLHAAIKQWK